MGTFYSNGALITAWNKNDFGKWSWNDEAATVAGKAFELTQSHGCVHLRPRDRDEMVLNRVLKAGVEVEVMQYGLVGPP